MNEFLAITFVICAVFSFFVLYAEKPGIRGLYCWAWPINAIIWSINATWL